jgi:hypothetical protein
MRWAVLLGFVAIALLIWGQSDGVTNGKDLLGLGLGYIAAILMVRHGYRKDVERERQFQRDMVSTLRSGTRRD